MPLDSSFIILPSKNQRRWELNQAGSRSSKTAIRAENYQTSQKFLKNCWKIPLPPFCSVENESDKLVFYSFGKNNMFMRGRGKNNYFGPCLDILRHELSSKFWTYKISGRNKFLRWFFRITSRFIYFLF